jgi:ribosome-associated toxin RatA of RatAB toxin-antitoxin module
MISIQRSALVNFSARQMYSLIDDIEQYPLFMHGCLAAEVISRTDSEVVGKLTLGKAGIRYSFSTRNLLLPGNSMQMQLIDGPFRKFDATWRFKPLSDSACKVSLDMQFEWAGGFLGAAMEKLFQHSANSLVDALVTRANLIYGSP